MTLEAEGSVTSLTSAGTPDVTASTGDTSGTSGVAATADPFAGLDTGTREWVGKKGYKDFAEVAKAAQNAESLIGQSVKVPGPEATAEDWQKFYAKVGRPEDPSKYEFKLPEGLPESVPYDAEFATTYKTWAHEAGLTPQQAQTLHDKWIGLVSERAAQGQTQAQEAEAATQAKLTADVEAAHDHIVRKFGDKDSPAYKAAVSIAEQAANQLAGGKFMAALEKRGLLGPGRTIVDPVIFDALHEIGVSHFKADGLETGRTTAPALSPAQRLYPNDPFRS